MVANNDDDISSQELETIEDEFSGLFCECLHLLDEHWTSSCHALVQKDNMITGCRCKKVQQFEFKIKIYVKEYI